MMMNKELQDYARQKIKDGLSQLTEGNQEKFKRMYSHGDLDRDICDVVDSMPEEKLDWAMTQVSNTIKAYKPVGKY